MKKFRLIAEIGGNHEGNFKKAKELLKLVKSSGAKIAKFQIYTGESLVNPVIDQARVEHFNKFALSTKQYLDLAKLSNDLGLEFNASVWNLDQLEHFDDYLKFYKIGSGDLTAFNFLSELCKRSKPILLSTGLANFDQIKRSVDFIRSVNPVYNDQSMLTLLQCTSMYPILDSEANLNVMSSYAELYDCDIGYSDHTIGTDAAELAYSMGAKAIEVHFTDRKKNRKFRDHQVSFTANDVRQLLLKFKKIDALKGSPFKTLTKSELENKHVSSFRRAVYPIRNIKKGSVCKLSDFVTLRPCQGVCATNYFKFKNAIALKDLSKNQVLSLNDFVFK